MTRQPWYCSKKRHIRNRVKAGMMLGVAIKKIHSFIFLLLQLIKNYGIFNANPRREKWIETKSLFRRYFMRLVTPNDIAIKVPKSIKPDYGAFRREVSYTPN